jgi:hypothetical protein
VAQSSFLARYSSSGVWQVPKFRSTMVPFGLMWKTARTVPTTPPPELRMVKKSVSVNWNVPVWALKVPPTHSAPLIE